MKKKKIDPLKIITKSSATPNQYRELPPVVKKIAESWNKKEYCDHVGAIPMPSHESVITILSHIRRILFPGYFSQTTINADNLEYYLGQEINILFEDLSRQILLAYQYNCLSNNDACEHCADRGQDPALKFIQQLPIIKELLKTDILAAITGDPAAKSQDEVIFSYPGLQAITTYRVANALYKLGVPFIPRIMTEHAHSRTGIDIHPGATIGESFFIDHGTGVVIGETTEIGNRVRLYQGVTLGALSLPHDAGEKWRNKKRHPTIEDDVIIYANTTVLGGDTVIGARSIVGGNIWLTESVPPDTKVLLKRPELIYSGNGKKK
ncbi:MAG: serine acetyltransferase [Proteobacteria bacterium]|nr:serine acetyltransferase [Pseudomonadota bacterium]MBU1710208.1 serine acetyltransferase [Pseudomonadota bacterium]